MTVLNVEREHPTPKGILTYLKLFPNSRLKEYRLCVEHKDVD